VPVLSLAQVLDMYSLHLKYLRRHTVSVLLSQSRVGDLYLQGRKSRTLFLDLENGLTSKELTITLEKCPALERDLVCKFVFEAGDSLDLILGCLYKLAHAFSSVDSQVCRVQETKSAALLTQLKDAVSTLNYSRVFFTQQPKVVSSEILYPVTLRKLRLREHNSALSTLLVTLDEITSADLARAASSGIL